MKCVLMYQLQEISNGMRLCDSADCLANGEK